MSKHLDVEGKYACEYCDFKTWDKYYLKKHVKKHEIEEGQQNQDGGAGMKTGSGMKTESGNVVSTVSQLHPKSATRIAPIFAKSQKPAKSKE